MDLRPTVDSLEPSGESSTDGSETPAVFSPAISPEPTPAEEPEESSQGQHQQPSPPRVRQPHRRRPRQVPPSTSVPESREVIDARVIDFLAQRRSDGVEEKMLRGLAPLLKKVPEPDHNACVASIAVVMKMFAIPNHGDILGHLNRWMVDLENEGQPQVAGQFGRERQPTQAPSFAPHPHQKKNFCETNSQRLTIQQKNENECFQRLKQMVKLKGYDERIVKLVKTKATENEMCQIYRGGYAAMNQVSNQPFEFSLISPLQRRLKERFNKIGTF
ncbi:uncharacterized protein LOC122945445 [Bufo gargarizans]|uniref:uncharacterized protein LOC122945445 n=1 Tax=Bufo gargarizans TaxID=30331 RepID=UPI001CF58FEB|nr:uncharacterized protein LOC122945445 [Bufo gargarizans]